MTIDIEKLMLNHNQQGNVIKKLQYQCDALQKEKRALMHENERLRDEIKNLQCQLMLSNKPRPKCMVINIVM